MASCDHKFVGTNYCLKCGATARELLGRTEGEVRQETGGGAHDVEPFRTFGSAAASTSAEETPATDALRRSSAPNPTTLGAIAAEVQRARTKFPGSRFLFTALVEEVGELARAILQRAPREQVVREAIQVAAVAVRIIEETDPVYADLTDAESKP